MGLRYQTYKLCLTVIQVDKLNPVVLHLIWLDAVCQCLFHEKRIKLTAVIDFKKKWGLLIHKNPLLGNSFLILFIVPQMNTSW